MKPLRLPGWERRRAFRRALGIPVDRLPVHRVGYRSHWFDDFYHYALVSPWWVLLAAALGGFVALNAVFAGAYLLVPGSIAGARPGSFTDAFFFSVQTVSTVGYGALLPQGAYANALAALESFLGLIGFAIVAGLVFARLARPTARVLFSHVAVVGRYEGQPALLVRLGNARNNQVFDARVQMALLRDVVTADGEPMRRFVDLPLVRDRTPVFSLTWLAVHVIDAASPLHGQDAATLERTHAHLFLSLVGVDETFAQTIHARRIYGWDEIAWERRFADILSRDADDRAVVDFRRFHDTEPLPAQAPAQPEGATVAPAGPDDGTPRR